MLTIFPSRFRCHSIRTSTPSDGDHHSLRVSSPWSAPVTVSFVWITHVRTCRPPIVIVSRSTTADSRRNTIAPTL